MTEVYERRWYGYIRIDKPDGEPLMRPAPLDESVSYEQWIGLLYACAVFRGVLSHPPAWPGSKAPVGFVARVDHA